MAHPFFILILLLGIAAAVEAGPIYVFKEKDGSTRFSSKPPPAGVQAQVFTGKDARYSVVISRGPGRSDPIFPERYAQVIEGASVRHGVDRSLIRAVIHAESGFRVRAVSPKGAQGLMQLMPETAKMMGVRDSFSPDENIDGGTRYLSDLIKRHPHNLTYAIAAYNAGPGAVDQYRGVPPYSETREYVKRVLRLLTRYQAHKKDSDKKGEKGLTRSSVSSGRGVRMFSPKENSSLLTR